MSPDVRHLVASLRVPGFRYRDLLTREPRRARPAPVQVGPLIVALVSLSRGAGRTTLAAHLARIVGRRAAAFDLDPSQALRTRLGDGPRVIPFGADPRHVIDSLSGNCDLLLVDTPAPPPDEVLAQADEALVVLRPDPDIATSIAQVDDYIASRRGTTWRRSPARYLVNGFDARRSSDVKVLSALRRALGARLFSTVVHEDPALRFPRLPEHSQAAADLDSLARELLPRRDAR